MIDDFFQFEKLITGGYSCISIITDEEDYALDIIRASAKKFGKDLWIWSVSEGVREGLGMLDSGPKVPDTHVPEKGLANLAGSKPGSICVTLDIAEHIKGGRPLRLLRDIIYQFSKTGSTIVLIDNDDKLPEVIKSYVRPFEISYPGEKEIEGIIRDTLQRLHRKKPIEIGITRKGLEIIIKNLRGLNRRQAEQIISDTIAANQRFDDDDINVVLASKRRMIQRGGLLEYIQTPHDLSEIGGMSRLKQWLELRKNAFTAQAEEFGITAPRGVLMLGVQGAGKSLCAKAIATAWHQPLLRMDPGALYGSYIGQSERNLREALKQTELMAPVILWIDEIEKAFASAASRSADGGLSQRMFGTLLTWLQERTQPVFVVATANDIEALPPELLRKGRFDEIFFIDLPKKEVRREIFTIHLKKRNRDPSKIDLEKLTEASEGYSGSEIEQAVIAGLYTAFSEKTELDTEKILDALCASPPLSVTMAERIRSLLSWAEGRCVPAD